MNGNVRSKKREKFESKRAEVLRTAARVFARLGFHRASLNDIADELGITSAALYYYTKSKDALLYEASIISVDRYDKLAESYRKDERSGLEKLREYFLIYAEGVGEDFDRCLALTDPNDIQSPDYRIALLERRRKIDHDVRQIVREGIADGSIRDCDVTVLVAQLFGSANHLARWCHPGGRLSAKAAMQIMLDTVIDGIRASGDQRAFDPSPR